MRCRKPKIFSPITCRGCVTTSAAAEAVGARMPPPQYVDHVLDGSAPRRGHHPNALRISRQRLLARPLEQSFRLQLSFELLESYLQRARAFGLQILGRKLQLAARFIHRHSPA